MERRKKDYEYIIKTSVKAPEQTLNSKRYFNVCPVNFYYLIGMNCPMHLAYTRVQKPLPLYGVAFTFLFLPKMVDINNINMDNISKHWYIVNVYQ